MSLSRRSFLLSATATAALPAVALPAAALPAAAIHSPPDGRPLVYLVVLTGKSKRSPRGHARVTHCTPSHQTAKRLAAKLAKAFGARFVSIVEGGAV